MYVCKLYVAHTRSNLELDRLEFRMRLTCRCRMRAANGCGGGRAGAGGGCGARTLADGWMRRGQGGSGRRLRRAGRRRSRRLLGAELLAPRADIGRRGWTRQRASAQSGTPRSGGGCRCRQWRTMAPEEGRGAAARADTTCSGPALSTKRASRLPRGAGHGARGGDPEGNRAAMAASGTS